MDDSDQDIINEQPTIEPIQSTENMLETIAALRSDISILLERVTQLEADNERITEQLSDRTESGTEHIGSDVSEPEPAEAAPETTHESGDGIKPDRTHWYFRKIRFW